MKDGVIEEFCYLNNGVFDLNFPDTLTTVRTTSPSLRSQLSNVKYVISAL